MAEDNNPTDKFPPLKSLVAFEATARLLNVTRAAEELGVTQSAVSQQLRNLEKTLGVQLFFRENLRLSLTRSGELLAPTVRTAFDSIYDRLSELHRHSRRVRVTADPNTYAEVLAPSLALFLKQHPSAQVWLSQIADFEEGAEEGFDILLVSDNVAWRYGGSSGLIPYPIDLKALAGQGLAAFVVPGMEMSEPVRLYLNWLNQRVAEVK